MSTMPQLVLRTRSARRRWLLAGALLATFWHPTVGQGASLTVGSGSTLAVGSGILDLGCADLTAAGRLTLGVGALTEIRDLAVAGELSATAGALHLRGDLHASGTLATGSTTLFLEDGCGRSSWTLADPIAVGGLDVASDGGKALHLPAAATTSVASNLRLAGGLVLLPVGSTAPGTAARLDLAPGATQSVFAIRARDLHAPGQWIAPGPAANYGSVDDGNLWRVFGSSPVVEIPALDHRGAAILALALLLAAFAVLRARLTRGA